MSETTFRAAGYNDCFSYGGTSVVTLLAGFGILMALYSHRKLVSS